MVLVDTSVWIEHFREMQPLLAGRLSDGLVLMHPFISGELACANLKNRAVLMSNLNALPTAKVATDEEVLHLVEDRKLWGRGLGWIDAHLLASALLSNCRLWTLDRSLRQAAEDLALY